MIYRFPISQAFKLINDDIVDIDSDSLVITGVLTSMLDAFEDIFINDHIGRLSSLRICRHKILLIQMVYANKHSSFIIIHSCILKKIL